MLRRMPKNKKILILALSVGLRGIHYNKHYPKVGSSGKNEWSTNFLRPAVLENEQFLGISGGNNRNTDCASSIMHEFQKFVFFPIFYDISLLLSRCPKNFGKKSFIVPTLIIYHCYRQIYNNIYLFRDWISLLYFVYYIL